MELWSWREIHEALVELELLNASLNFIGRFFIPLAITIDYCVAIMSAVVFLHLNNTMLQQPLASFFYFIFPGVHFAAVVAGYGFFRCAETLAAEADGVLKAYEVKIRYERKRYGGVNDRRGMEIGSYNCRMFRRNPLRIRVWYFTAIESGMALEYLLSMLERLLTASLMLDVTTPPQLLYSVAH